MNTLYIIALICVGIGSIGAIALTIIQSIGSTNDKNEIINTTKNENLVLKTSLDNLMKERDELSKNLENRDAKIREQTDYIIKLNEKLAEKSEYIQNFLTGGDSYIFLEMRKISNNGEFGENVFQLNNEFELPIYNIECDILDYDQIKNKTYHKKNINGTFINKNDYLNAKVLSEQFSEMPGKTWKAIDKPFSARNCLFHASIRTRNRTVIAKMTTLIIGKGDYYGFQILDLKGNILKEDINPEMPKIISDQVKNRLKSIPTNIQLLIE